MFNVATWLGILLITIIATSLGQDINECSLGISGCNQMCNNTNGSYICFCYAGYTLAADNQTCFDADECILGTSGCNQMCNNTNGSYICSCYAGYKLAANNQTCNDIDECVLGTSGCNQMCNNTNGSYICSCRTGYKLAANNQTCNDIDECILGTSGCNHICNNTNGSYICSCRTGYKLAANNQTCNGINECKLGTSGCNQMCNNTNGTYICSCSTGYRLAANNQTCNDINECILGTSGCNQMCNNTNGSYICSCHTGYKLAVNNQTCSDINECILGTSGCNQMCNNTNGSYRCSCSTGYKLTADNHTCNDINECLLGTSGCTQLCNNTAGGYKCSCSSGYTLAADNRTCTVEINAYNNCSFNNGHGPCGQICNQLPRSVYCTCEYGYSLLEDHFHCLGAPRDLRLTATKSSITATWKPALYDGLETKKLKYVLACSSGNYKVEKDTGNSTNATLVNLAPFTTFSCCVSANASIQPQSLACSSIQTMEDAPSDPPSNVYSAPFSYKAVVIRWDPPLVPNGYIIGSNIYLNYSNGTQNTIKLTGGDYRRYLLQNMQADQEVGIQISSSTIGGEGPRSIMQQGRTNCASGTYYSKSSRKCTSQCGCGEGQVQYYYDSISDSWYSACVPVQAYQVGITSISKSNSVYTNSPPGTLAATVHVTYPLPLSNQIQMSMTSYFYTSYFDSDWWRYWWTPTLLNIANHSTNQVENPTWSGWWSTSKYINWQDISSSSMTCNTSIGQYAITPINIYLASSPRYQGELRLDLYFVQSYYYYWYNWYWYYYGYVSGLSIQVKQHYNCSSLQYYDFTAQGCVGLCSCGSALPKGSTFCTTINPYWNFATFAHHTIIHQIPYTDPVIPSITTRLYYTLNDWISRYFFDYYFYHAASNDIRIMLKLSLQYEYSKYTTPAAFGTDVPNVALTLADGTTIRNKGSASIVLDDNLSPLTKSCARDSDSVNLMFIPFEISVSFKEPVSSLGTHNFTITAQLTSTERIIDSWLQYYTDEMLLSITVGPDCSGSKPTSSCTNILNNFVPMFEISKYTVKTLPHTLYSISDRIIIDPGFPFGNSLQSEVYISSNGLISFGKPVVYSYPAKFPTNYEGIRNAYLVAPFWSFNDIRVAGNVSYATISGSDDVTRVNKYIRNYYKTNFTALWVLVVQWSRVHPYPHGESGWQWWWDYSYYTEKPAAIINKENTYQAVLATDGVSSYAIFTYDCDKMGWSEGYWSGWNAVVGYTANGEYYRNHPASGYDFIAEAVSCQNKNCNWALSSIVYNLSLPTSEINKLRSDCLYQYQEDVALNGTNKSIADLSAHLEPCPCTLWQAFQDFGRFQWQYADYYCFIQRTPASGTTATQQCCYSSWSTGEFGALIKSGIDKGSMYLYHPRRYPDLHKKYDLDFKDKCCGIANMCYLYNERRPSNNCTGYSPPVFMRANGDPHITSLDGRTYTFNGWGEYIMLQYLPSNMEDSFTLQGRMVPSNNSAATQFSAFAFEDSNNTIEIGMIDKNKFYSYINGMEISNEIAQINSTYNNSDETIVIIRETETSISCVTLAGVGITIKNTYGALSFAATVPPSWKGLTKGLMGNFNGNKSDEFIPRNIGMPLPDAISDRNLHWMFAQTWNVSEHESLFTYRVNRNESWQYYSHPDHIPVFADEIVATEAQMGICGNDAQCLYDLSQTNNTTFALETMQYGQINTLNVQIINNFPPTINGSSTFVVIVGQESIYQFIVEDTNDNITVGVVGGILFNATLLGSNGTYTFSSTISKVDNVSLSFFAKDSLNATSILSVQVQICACRNGGNCTLDGLSNNDDPSVVMKCDCPKAYDGTFCDGDRNGCLEASCYSGVQCVDVPAPGVGIKCGLCPKGYLGDGTVCIDIDECSSNGSTCQQVCKNTPGSYTCSCQDGYFMMPNGVCTDIDECSGINECQQSCTNTAGSYYCSCMDGFQLNSDGYRCTATNPCAPGNNCSDTCVLVNNTATCFCSLGFRLNTDLKTCIDINECSQNPCSQICRNTIGSFQCSCVTGYQLNADGRICDDIDECLVASVSGDELCPVSFECLNTVGSYMCTCPPGYHNKTGLCQDIDECADNNGNCSQRCTNYAGSYMCTCSTGYYLEADSKTCNCSSGNNCSNGTYYCTPATCLNGGTCVDGTLTNCTCATGFAGTNCSIDLNYCAPTTCLNGGTCIEGHGTLTSCTCAAGFTGTDCSIDLNFCAPTTCLNGGTCVEGYGTLTSCTCAAGFTGTNCSIDLNFCAPTTCLNGGTCVEGHGTLTSCTCAAGFTGTNCSIDLNFCVPTTCLNGGTCIEGYGTLTSCTCAAGFSGINCSIDLNYCAPSTCLNGGTCAEGYSTHTSCICAAGFTGTKCSIDINFCAPTTCLNGGTCAEGYGTFTNCTCAAGFTGTNCSIDLNFCAPTTCLNGGTCVEGYGTLTSCTCAAGFSGINCSIDLNYCAPSTCLNGGTCIEGYGSITTCICAAHFEGNDCSLEAPLHNSSGSFECMNTISSYQCVCPPGYQNRSGLCQANVPPKIMGERNSLLVKIGEPAVYHFSVIDDGDTFTVGVVGGTPAGSNLSNEQGNYSFTWILEQVQNITLKFHAIDSLNVTAELSVQVVICACQNKGNCTLKGLENITDAQSVIMNCDCHIAYDGRFCERDRNGCLEASCSSGVQCYDVPAPGVGRTCGLCLKGYFGDGQNCSDINECADNNGNCSHRCTNYAGGYLCTCSAGYYLETDSKSCKSISASLNTVDITLAGYTVDSFTPEVRSKFITSIQNILNTYCNSVQCLSAPMNATKYTVIIRNAVDSTNGLTIALQVQASSFLLSSAVITMALKAGNSTLFSDGFIAVSITPSTETSPMDKVTLIATAAIAVIVTILVAVISIVSVILLLVRHKQKKQQCMGEELNMKTLEHKEVVLLQQSSLKIEPATKE